MVLASDLGELRVYFRLMSFVLLTLLVVVRPMVLGDLEVLDFKDNRRWSFERNMRWYRKKAESLMLPHSH